MVRKLKHHEQKLLKKVDFINWEVDNNLHEVKVMKRWVKMLIAYCGGLRVYNTSAKRRVHAEF